MATPTMPKPAPNWVQYGDGWVPPDHPLALSLKPTTPVVEPAPVRPSPTPTPTVTTVNKPAAPVVSSATPVRPAPAQPPTTMPSPGPGWVRYADGWVPSNHPLITGIYDPPTPVAPAAAPAQASVSQAAPSSSAPAVASGGELDGPAVAAVVPAVALSSLPYLGSLQGFDHNKLGNPNHMTIKYQLGRLFAQYPPTPAGMAELVRDPAFQALGVQSVGGGNIKLPDGAVIDVIQNFQQGGGNWWWGDDRETGGTSPAPGGTTPYPGGGGGTTEPWPVTPGPPVPPWPGAGTYVPGSGTTAPGEYGIPGYGSEVTSDEFTDPTTANLEALLNWRINELINPVDDPARQQYADLLQQYVQSLSQTDPAITNMVGALETQAANYLKPTSFEPIAAQQLNNLAGMPAGYQSALDSLMSLLQQPSGGENLASSLGREFQTVPTEYRQQADARVAQLQADPYTGAEWEMYRTGVLDPIEQDRKAAQDRALAEISQRGIDPSSGIAQQMLLEVNRQFDQSRAVEQGNLGRARVEQRQARQGEAFDIQSALQDLLQSRQTQGLTMQTAADQMGLSRLQGGVTAQTDAEALQRSRDTQRTGLAQNMADWTSGRGERAAQLYSTLAEIPTARAQQQLQGAQTLDSLSQGVRGEEQSRRAEALALQGLLAELPERRLQLALATLGEGSTPESMLGSLTGLAGLANQRQATSAAQSRANWTGLGSLASILAGMFNKSGNGATATNSVWGDGLP